MLNIDTIGLHCKNQTTQTHCRHDRVCLYTAVGTYSTVIQPSVHTVQLYSRRYTQYSYTAVGTHSTAIQQSVHTVQLYSRRYTQYSYTAVGTHSTVIQPSVHTVQLYSRRYTQYSYYGPCSISCLDITNLHSLTTPFEPIRRLGAAWSLAKTLNGTTHGFVGCELSNWSSYFMAPEGAFFLHRNLPLVPTLSQTNPIHTPHAISITLQLHCCLHYK
jgi:hypothetical protein